MKVPNEFRQGAWNGYGQLVQLSTKTVHELLHCRLGNMNMKSVHALQNMVSGINLSKQKSSHIFSCFVKRVLRVNNIGWRFAMTMESEQLSLWMLCIRMCVAIGTISIGSARYFTTFNNQFLRKVWMYISKK